MEDWWRRLCRRLLAFLLLGVGGRRLLLSLHFCVGRGVVGLLVARVVARCLRCGVGVVDVLGVVIVGLDCGSPQSPSAMPRTA